MAIDKTVMDSEPTRQLLKDDELRPKKKVHFVVRRFYFIKPDKKWIAQTNPSDLYYTKEDYDMLFDEVRAILQMMQTCSTSFIQEDNCSTSRGLEELTPDGSTKRNWNYSTAFQAVVQEQLQQREDGVYDPEGIAEVYKRASEACTRQAYNRGVKDAITARTIFDEEPMEYVCRA
jgi:hypothetical protein